MAARTAYSLEQAFNDAYANHYGQPPSQIRTLDDGRLLINGIAFTDREVVRMIQTLEKEQQKKRQSLVKRMISFFGGRQN